MKLRGFTLIELLAVIGIIGILVTAIAVNLYGSKPKARNAKRIEHLQTVQKAILQYADDNDDLVPPGDSDSMATTTAYQSLSNYILPDYLSWLPKDPSIEVAGSEGDYQYLSRLADGVSATTDATSARRFSLIAPSTEAEGSESVTPITFEQ